MLAQHRTRRGTAEQQRQRAEREWKMAGAEHKSPYHPQHPAILEFSRIGNFAVAHVSLGAS
jgi:hypothetical protein